MKIGPEDEKPTPWMVTTEPTEPEIGLIRVIVGKIQKVVFAFS